MIHATCPECDGDITLASAPERHQRIICPHCRSVLSAKSLNPLLLDWAFVRGFEEDEHDAWPAARHIPAPKAHVE
jgi:lysine biosynthesis protein LysW